MMRSCEKCLENIWTYQHIDGWIKATCTMCAHEVEFEAVRKKNGQSKWYTTKKCLKCNSDLKKKEKKHLTKPNKGYHYGAVWLCTSKKCTQIYMSGADKCECDKTKTL